MCPSYRVTRDERDVTRGRANTLRLAITGQFGPDALTSDDMAETLKLCVSCKACRRECPTGVDMARMKIEVQAARAEKHGLSLRDRLVGYLPRYAPYAARMPWLMNARDAVPGRRGCRRGWRDSAACGRCRSGASDVFEMTGAVMAGLVSGHPRLHLKKRRNSWMPGTRPWAWRGRQWSRGRAFCRYVQSLF